ncbi:hypothetical protein EB796_006419 [Bugula neritina]|uniref:Uncharacterized protein n=1 Tax=Bugula neritina TaxID=10212 RepID=A0A7J7KAK0_BUGNE|nr:hypothetical protein EB796_006419 [Bugula neritina]
MESTQTKILGQVMQTLSALLLQKQALQMILKTVPYMRSQSPVILTEEINPRLCAVSTNPVDEDDGQLSLSGLLKRLKVKVIESEDQEKHTMEGKQSREVCA